MSVNSIAFIPDGNRRYAKKVGISSMEAYQAGFNKAEEVFDWCVEKKIRFATIYSLSSENLNRTTEQLMDLFLLYRKHLTELIDNEKIHANEVKVRVTGRINRVPGLSSIIEKLHNSTAKYDKHHLNIALGYGGREEIVDAAKRISDDGLEMNEENFSKYLYTDQDPELLVRTSGIQRLSNFLPWQAIYTELYFCKSLWPEFSKQNFNEALAWYDQTKRNFGR